MKRVVAGFASESVTRKLKLASLLPTKKETKTSEKTTLVVVRQRGKFTHLKDGCYYVNWNFVEVSFDVFFELLTQLFALLNVGRFSEDADS